MTYMYLRSYGQRGGREKRLPGRSEDFVRRMGDLAELEKAAKAS